MYFSAVAARSAGGETPARRSEAMDLTNRRCVPCDAGTPRLTAEQAAEYLAHVPGWELRDERIVRSLVFRDFVEAMRFVNAVAEVAEAEGHHPDFCVHWNRVDLTVWTHAIGGLSENDFVLAAKIDQLPKG
jgi:4a-hydroxytetrahydrobiopterin dehydratase